MIFFLLFNSLFLIAQSMFLVNLEKKPKSEQLLILEKRIAIEVKLTEKPLDKSILEYYLKLSSELSHGLNFIIDQIALADGLSRTTLIQALAESCEQTKCLNDSKVYKKFVTDKSYASFLPKATRYLSLETGESFLGEKEKLIKLLNLSFQESSGLPDEQDHILGQLIEFGLYSEVQKLLGERSSSFTQMGRLYKCLVEVYIQGRENMKKCFQSLNGEIAKLYYYHLTKIIGLTIEKVELKSFLRRLESIDVDVLKGASFVLKLHLEGKLEKSELDWLQEYLLKNLDYKRTFTFLSLAETYKLDINQDLRAKFQSQYSELLLVKVLNKKVKPEYLKQLFGPYSLLYDVSKN